VLFFHFSSSGFPGSYSSTPTPEAEIKAHPKLCNLICRGTFEVKNNFQGRHFEGTQYDGIVIPQLYNDLE
jgi:hypothetical protein